jgi:hypothetical protein
MESSRARLVRSWKAPVFGGLVALVIAFCLCAGLVAWAHKVFPSGDPNAPRRFKQSLPVLAGGGATFYAFQRVPMNMKLRESTTETVNSRFETPERGDLRVVVSPLGGLLLVGLALVAGGAVAWRKRDPSPDTIARSAIRMATVFAVACLGLSFMLPLADTTLEPLAYARRSTMLAYVPSHLGAFVWPFTWALIFGSLGMHVARHRAEWVRQLFSRIAARKPDGANALRGALSGLAAGAVLVIVAGLVAAGVAIAQHPAGAGAVLGSGRNVAGIAEGVVLGLPHATGAGLLGSMGVPARYEAPLLGSGEPRVGSVGIFGGASGRDHGSIATAVPRYALGGLAIAAIFTVVTGFRAAAGAGGDAERAIRAAYMAAGLLTVFLWIIAYLVRGRARLITGISEQTSEFHGSIGASLIPVIFLPLVWSFGGGLVGALLWIRGSRAREMESPAAAGPSTGHASQIQP